MKRGLRFSFFLTLLMGVQVLWAQVTPVLVAEGFSKGLIGLEVDAAGNIWATEHGTGNDDGEITIIDAMGGKTTFMTGLPSTFIQAAGEVVGSYRTYQRPDNKVLVVVGEGTNALSEKLLLMDKGDFTPGTPLTVADVEVVIDHGTFVHGLGFEQSNPFNVDWDADGNILIADSGANSIVKWDRVTGQFSIVKTMDRFPNPLPIGPPMVDPVPTKVLVRPDGTMLVSQLTGFPFLQGAAKVHTLNTAGDLGVHAEGFTCLTDMAFDPTDGNLCVLQFGVFGEVNGDLGFQLGTSAVIKLLPDGSRDTMAQGIGGLAAGFTFDAAGNLYVSDLVFGQVLRYDLVSSADEAVVSQADVRAFPNPTGGPLTIAYELHQAAPVSVTIHNLMGQEVARLQGGQQAAGPQMLHWDGRTEGGQMAPAGVYVYRLVAGRSVASGVVVRH